MTDELGAVPSRPVLILLLFILPCVIGVSTTCYNGICYEKNVTLVTWAVALTTCEESGGTLAIVNTLAIHTHLDTAGVLGSEPLWVGLSDGVAEGGWRWVDGWVPGWALWGAGQPDGQATENCVYVSAPGKDWADGNCTAPHGFLCQDHNTTDSPACTAADLPSCVSGQHTWFYNISGMQCLDSVEVEMMLPDLSACRHACATRVDFKCAAIDYDDVLGTCHLSVSTTASVCNGSVTYFRHFGEHNPWLQCYHGDPVGRTFAEARVGCGEWDEGFDLVSVTYISEDTAVGALQTELNMSSVWLGLTDMAVEGVYQWVDKAALYYTHWRPALPDSSGGQLDCTQRNSSTGDWSFANCTDILPYICKRSRNYVCYNSYVPVGASRNVHGSASTMQLVCSGVNVFNDSTGDQVKTLDCNCSSLYEFNRTITTFGDCVYIDECQSDPCLNGGTCIDGIGSYSCSCPTGYTGVHCDTNSNTCASNPCQHAGMCVDGLGVYTCACGVAYTGVNCETDIQECASTPCAHGGVCVEGVGAYVCTCPSGWDGVHCELSVTCLSNPCLHGSTCVEGFHNYHCECMTGFAGSRCETDINECALNPCEFNHECVDHVNGYQCQCRVGYTGTRCEVLVDECASSPCQNNGTCVDYLGAFRCDCPLEFVGSQCELDNFCFPQPCLRGGTCTSEPGQFVCRCLRGYTGTHCQLDVNECLSSPCYSNATCIDITGAFECVCPTGMTGTRCDRSRDVCSSQPCQHGATCRAVLGAYLCECPPGYEGSVCGTDTDNCIGDPCSNGGLCRDRVDAFQCICHLKYTGTYCDEVTEWVRVRRRQWKLTEAKNAKVIFSILGVIVMCQFIFIILGDIPTVVRDLRNMNNYVCKGRPYPYRRKRWGAKDGRVGSEGRGVSEDEPWVEGRDGGEEEFEANTEHESIWESEDTYPEWDMHGEVGNGVGDAVGGGEGDDGLPEAGEEGDHVTADCQTLNGSIHDDTDVGGSGYQSEDGEAIEYDEYSEDLVEFEGNFINDNGTVEYDANVTEHGDDKMINDMSATL